MGVSTKVFVNFKNFSQDNLHIVKDFISRCRKPATSGGGYKAIA